MSLGLLGSYYSSSSEDEDEDCDKTEITRKAEGTDDSNNAPKLANPFQKSASHSLKPSYMVATEDLSAAKQKLTCEGAISVFNNPFRAKEDRKRAVLEQHVEMTTKQEDQTRKIGSRKICFNFRKGRCRFGHKCTFAHDSDVASSLASAEESTQNINYSTGLLADKPVDPMKPVSLESKSQGEIQLKRYDEQQMNQMFEPSHEEAETVETSCVVISNNKRKTTRPGLGDDVVPGKKARKFHNKVYGNNL